MATSKVHLCPRCILRPMEAASHAGHPVDVCPRCAGLWCRPADWQQAQLGPYPAIRTGPPASDRLAQARDLTLGPEPAATTDVAFNSRDQECPECHSPLVAVRVGGPDGCVLDQCPACGGVWFDQGEWDHLHLLEELRRQQDRVARPTTWGQWCLQFFTTLPVEFNLRPRRFPYVTVALIVLCVLVLLAQLAAPEQAWLGFAAIPLSILQGQNLVTVLTCLFLHIGLLHLVGNMYFLFILGDNVEDALGHVPYLLFYLACGVISVLLHVLVFRNDVPVVGASGAVCGVMAAYLLLYPKARLTLMLLFWQVKLPVLGWMAVYFAVQVLAGLWSLRTGGASVAYFGHLGGFLAGLALIYPFRSRLLARDPWLRVLNTRPLVPPVAQARPR